MVSIVSVKRIADVLGISVSDLSTPGAFDSHEELLADLRAHVLQFKHDGDDGNMESRLVNTVAALERVLDIGILDSNDKVGLCRRSELAVVLALLLSRVAYAYGQSTKGMSENGYDVLIVDAIAATANALVQGVYENYHFKLLANAVHPDQLQD